VSLSSCATIILYIYNEQVAAGQNKKEEKKLKPVQLFV